MKDKENSEIKVGDLVKKCGYVTYADGAKYKISKKTWQVSKVEGDNLFYRELGVDVKGQEIEQDALIPRKEGIEFLVVGDGKGLKKEYKTTPKVLKIDAGSTGGNYRVLKDIEDKKWKVGDVVRIHGKVSFETLEKGYLEKVSDDLPNKHALIVADLIKVGMAIHNAQ